jgi:hypothetical protein
MNRDRDRDRDRDSVRVWGHVRVGVSDISLGRV